jgi:hypothetical protein
MKTQPVLRFYSVAGVLLAIASFSSAHAALTMTLSGTPGSSIINVSFSGTSTVGRSSGGIVNFGWDFAPTNFNPFPPQITGSDFGRFNFISGSAQFLNLTSHQSSSITGIWLQDSSNSPFPGWERFGMLDSTSISYVAGDVFQWSGSATIDLSAKGLTFDSLHLGSTGPVYPADPVTSGILQGELVIVPEPSVTVLLATAGIVFLMMKRRHQPQIE